MFSLLSHYFSLTKPSIMLLVLVTGATALFLEGSVISEPGKFTLILLGLYLTGGGANALNQCFERNIDSQMKRTRLRRALPMKKISVRHAFIFSISISVAGVLIFWMVFNWLSAALAGGTILYYSLFYTLLLKPHTTQNIVVGGAAGAMAPIIAWAAVTGTTALTPWILFLLVFFWTPPHFWALALYFKEDFKEANLPMLPVIKGDDITLKHMLIHLLILLAISAALFVYQSGILYLIVAIVFGVIFLKKILDAKKIKSPQLYWGVFNYSIVYLFVLFIVIVADNFIPY